MFFKSIKGKIVTLTIVTIVVVTVFQLISFSASMGKLSGNAQATTQKEMLKEVQNGLKNTVDAMISSLNDLYKNNSGVIPEDRLFEMIRKTLDASRYGDSGYFFAYRYDGIRVVAPENKSQEGQNLWDLTDKSGKKVVQEFIKTAQSGGGFVSYIWLNPKTNKEEEKLSYVAPLKLGNLDLVVGTGTYLSRVETAKEEVAGEIGSAQKTIYMSSVFTSVVVLLILALITYFLIRSLTTPLVLAVEHLGKIAIGDFTQSVPEKYLGMKDEIGKLAQAIDRLQNNFKNLLGQVKVNAQTLYTNSEALSASSEEMASSSSEVAKAVQQVAAGAGEQSTNLQDILNLLENMAASLEKVDSELSKVKSNSEETSRLAGLGKKELDILITSIGEVREAFKAVGEKLGSLKGSVNQIGEILEVINGIAEQTNLLALNAAIEAARAGEAGRGFAVVAEEVRKLAEESRASSEKIRNLLDKIGAETTEVVRTSEEVGRQVAVQVENVENTVKSFDAILDSVAAMAPIIEATYREVDGTVKAKDIVLERIQSISAVAEETSASAEEIAASAEELSASTQEIAANAQQVLEVARRLEEQVGQFRL